MGPRDPRDHLASREGLVPQEIEDPMDYQVRGVLREDQVDLERLEFRDGLDPLDPLDLWVLSVHVDLLVSSWYHLYVFIEHLVLSMCSLPLS